MTATLTVLNSRNSSDMDSLTDLRASREAPWFNFVLPWEQPKRFHGRRKWRKRQERIFWLERSLGYCDQKWEFCQVFPWRSCYADW